MSSIKIIICLFALSVTCISHTIGANVFRKQERAVPEVVSSKPTPDPKSSCELTTPCGWAVYKRFTRNVEYFMKNKCDCPENKKCLRTEDDISVTAYVYKCLKPEPKEVTTEHNES